MALKAEYVEDDDDVMASAVPGNALIAQQHEKAAMDVQVATAQALGRSIQRFQDKLEEWTTHDPDIAADCTFSLKKGGKRIIGPSIRFAECLQQAYRHLFVDSFIEEEAHAYVVVGAVCRDTYENTAIRIRVRRSILTREGKRYGPDLIQQAVQAATSIAVRNAIIRVVPRALWYGIWIRTQEVAQGIGPDGKRVMSHSEMVDRAIKHFCSFGATEEEILAYLGRAGRPEIDKHDLLDLRNKAQSVRAGELDISEALRVKDDGPPPPKKSVAEGRLAEEAQPAAQEAPPPKEEKPKKERPAKAKPEPATAGEVPEIEL